MGQNRVKWTIFGSYLRIFGHICNIFNKNYFKKSPDENKNVKGNEMCSNYNFVTYLSAPSLYFSKKVFFEEMKS